MKLKTKHLESKEENTKTKPKYNYYNNVNSVYIKIIKLPSREELHKSYAGTICNFDFEGYNSLSSEANRIKAAQNFEKSIRYKGSKKRKYVINSLQY